MPALKTFRPVGSRIVAYGAAVVLIVLTVSIGIALPPTITFVPLEFGLLGAMLAGSFAALHGVGRSYVKLGDDGMDICNGYTHHYVTWEDIVGIAMNSGAPWPTLVLKDDERVIMFAIQGTDGPAAREAVEIIRSYL